MGKAVNRHNFTPEEITIGLTALAAFQGNSARAAEYLHDEQGRIFQPTTLRVWAKRHREEYAAIREKMAPQLEEQLAADLLDVATLAARANHYAIEAAERRLAAGEDQDPGRTAANLARVVQVSTDKMLSLTGRPTRITESRGAEEILRGLVAMGVLKPPESPGEIEAQVIKDETEAA